MIRYTPPPCTSIFEKVPGTNVTLVHTRRQSVMRRLAMPRWMPAPMRDIAVREFLRVFPATIVGTVAKSRNGWRIYISPAHLGEMTMHQITAHERFHTWPIIGISEILAHYWGGLHRRPGQMSWRYALHDVLFLFIHRPWRFAAEASTAASLFLILLFFI